jgi:hypothetical protein
MFTAGVQGLRGFKSFLFRPTNDSESVDNRTFLRGSKESVNNLFSECVSFVTIMTLTFKFLQGDCDLCSLRFFHTRFSCSVSVVHVTGIRVLPLESG